MTCMPSNLQTSEIVIDPEFASLLAPLSHSELSELEQSLKLVGCREALKVWHLEGKWILLDGHNRYRICLEHGIPFRVEAVELESRELALLWIERTRAAVAREARLSQRKLRLAGALKLKAVKVLGCEADRMMLRVRRAEISISAAQRELVRIESDAKLRAARVGVSTDPNWVIG